MARNQKWLRNEDGTLTLIEDIVVPDVFIPLTQELVSNVLNGTDISAMSLVDIIALSAQLVPHTAKDVDVLTSYCTNKLMATTNDDEEERINKAIKQLLHISFAHEVRLRVLEGKATTAPDRAAADTITTDFITLVTRFRTIRQEGEDYKTAQGF